MVKFIYVVVYTPIMEIPSGKIHIVKIVPQRGKKAFYYARINARVNGKPRVIWSLSLGTAENIVKHYREDRTLDYIEFQPFSFGIPAAFLAVAEKIDFFNIVDSVAPKKLVAGALTTSQYLLAMMTGRAIGPLSKAKTGRLFTDTFLNLVWKPVHHLNTQNFVNHMDKLTIETVDKITDAIGEKLVSMGWKPSLLLWDTTNFSTNIENFGEKTLPQHGNAKDKRFDKNIVGTGIVLSNDEIPLYHQTYPGNENDSNLFKRSINDIVAKVQKLCRHTDKMTLVFDKGVNSEDNIGSVLKSCHVVGGVSFDMVPDMLSIPHSKFRFAYRSTNGAKIMAYRETRKLWNNEEFVVIVTHNSETEKRQRVTWEKAKSRIERKLIELKEKFERSEGRGRRLTVKGLTTQISQTIPKQYRAVYWWNIDGTQRKFDWKLLEEKEKEFMNRFGKNVIFTDLTKWDTARIVRTYHSKWKMEKAFRWLHGKLLIPIPPIYHSEDERIRVHIFLCIMALTFVRLIANQLKGLSVSDEQLLEDMRELKVALVKDIRTDEAQLKIMEMNRVQAAVFSQLRLDEWLKVI